MNKKQPIGFLSYARKDDKHDDGYIRELASYIANEIAVQSGVEYKIFVDNQDINWGQTWESALTSSISSAYMLFPVITPNYFNSEYCRKEVSDFINSLENKNNRIFPIYYINCENIATSNKAFFKSILDNQYLDWRNLRFEPLSTPEVRKSIALAVADIIEPLVRLKRHGEELVSDENTNPNIFSVSSEKSTYKEKLEPFTIIVDQNSGKYTDISSAIKDAPSGARILVKAGVYHESIVIDKALEIIGLDEQKNNIKIISNTGATCIIRANIGRISNLTIYQNGKNSNPAIEIEQGRFDIQYCSISSNSGNGISINSASPGIRGCKISHCGSGGIIFKEGSNGSIEDCDIYQNNLTNIFIIEKSNPSIRRNRIFNGNQSGLYIYDDGAGIIEENDIFNNAHAGIATSMGGNPIARNNLISNSRQYGGIYIFKSGRGVFESNELRNNSEGQIQITEKCKPHITLKNNILK